MTEYSSRWPRFGPAWRVRYIMHTVSNMRLFFGLHGGIKSMLKVWYEYHKFRFRRFIFTLWLTKIAASHSTISDGGRGGLHYFTPMQAQTENFQSEKLTMCTEVELFSAFLSIHLWGSLFKNHPSLLYCRLLWILQRGKQANSFFFPRKKLITSASTVFLWTCSMISFPHLSPLNTHLIYFHNAFPFLE